MSNQDCCDELKDLEGIIQNLTAQGDDCKLLFNNTTEFKRLLSEGCDEDVLAERLKERGILLDKLESLKEYCDSVKGYLTSIKNKEQKGMMTSMLQQIQQQLEGTLSLNTEITNLLNQCISEININLRKIREGKSLMNTLRDTDARSSVHFDVSG